MEPTIEPVIHAAGFRPPSAWLPHQDREAAASSILRAISTQCLAELVQKQVRSLHVQPVAGALDDRQAGVRKEAENLGEMRLLDVPT